MDSNEKKSQLICYMPLILVSVATLIGFAVIFYLLSSVKNFRFLDWFIILLVIIIANLLEYFSHRFLLHSSLPIFGSIFRQHIYSHHKKFTHHRMGFDFQIGPNKIFLPFVGTIIISILVLSTFFVFWFLLNKNIAIFFLVTTIIYYFLYEWMHFFQHLPDSMKIIQIPILGKLRQFHSIHHNLLLMDKYNFNITFPLWDFIMGTFYSKNSIETTQS